MTIQLINMTKSQAPLSLEHILLGFLCQESTDGYDLYKKINGFEGISLVWNIKQSLLYAMLDKLEKKWIGHLPNPGGGQGNFTPPAGCELRLHLNE
jgi:hypothetical protein